VVRVQTCGVVMNYFVTIHDDDRRSSEINHMVKPPSISIAYPLPQDRDGVVVTMAGVFLLVSLSLFLAG